MPWPTWSKELHHKANLPDREAPRCDQNGPKVESRTAFEGCQEADGKGDSGPYGNGCEGYEDAGEVLVSFRTKSQRISHNISEESEPYRRNVESLGISTMILAALTNLDVNG